MPHTFACPHCGSTTLVDDQYSGQSGPCAACGQTIQIPDFLHAAPTTPEGPRDRFRGLSVSTRIVIAVLIAALITVGALSFVRWGSVAVQRAQATSLRARSAANLQKIAEALNAYADDYGSYPPPALLDANGKPLLSWRVLILPYLGRQDLYGRFSLNERWDSSTNQSLQFDVPSVYQSPAEALAAGTINYFLITGPGTLFPPSGPLGPDQATDGAAETLLVVESARQPGKVTVWTEPMDLDITKMTFKIGVTPEVEIGGSHPNCAVVATVDERGHILSDTTPSSLIRALITPQGGEAVPDDTLE